MTKLNLTFLTAGTLFVLSCAGIQVKTRSVLDTVSGILVMANSFVNTAEAIVDLDSEAALDAWIGVKQHLLIAGEYIETAYELLETNPEKALEYAACSTDGITTAFDYAAKVGLRVPKSIKQSIASAKDEIGSVVCGK
jgi:hypothetical protein